MGGKIGKQRERGGVKTSGSAAWKRGVTNNPFNTRSTEKNRSGGTGRRSRAGIEVFPIKKTTQLKGGGVFSQKCKKSKKKFVYVRRTKLELIPGRLGIGERILCSSNGTDQSMSRRALFRSRVRRKTRRERGDNPSNTHKMPPQGGGWLGAKCSGPGEGGNSQEKKRDQLNSK